MSGIFSFNPNAIDRSKTGTQTKYSNPCCACAPRINKEHSLGKDAVLVSEDWAAGWDSLEELDAEELDADDTVCYSTSHFSRDYSCHK